MGKTKVLILQPDLKQYRCPTWNLIADKYDLTLGYLSTDGTKDCDCRYKKVQLPSRHFGSFLLTKGLGKYAKQFDVVIFMPDPHVPSFCLLPFLHHKYKLLTWSIGFRCSYVHPYLTNRKHDFFDKFYELMFKKVDANIFYMEKAKEFWKHSKLDLQHVFVAPNTTEVESIEIKPEKKRNILFVGTLYKGKGIDILLKSFQNAIKRTNKDSKLVIIGKGEMKNELESFVNRYDLSEYVEFTGAIYDEKLLAEHFQEALLCVSPTQGGLSCPKSMGYGVPFVCQKNAITGGEIYHMTSGVDGIMYDNSEDLTDVLVDAIENPDKYVEMGRKAKDYYLKHATPNHMAQGAIDAIEYVLNHN